VSLGCASSYTVELRTRGGKRRAARFGRGVQRVEWNRLLTGTSSCDLEIVPRSRACARDLNVATSWAHELCVWRDGQQVWEGPLVDKEDTGSSVILTAKDLTAWLPVRIVHEGYDTTLDPVELTALARRVLVDAYAPDDPEAVRHIQTVPAGLLVARAVASETVMADAELAALVKLGLDWTVVGRRIWLFSAGKPLGQIAPLTGNHFTGNLPVVEAGGAVVTRMVVQGGGVRGEAGGVHPVLGLLERLETQSLVSTVRDAESAARSGLYTPTMMLAGTADLALTPRAPVAVGQLIPGVQAQVSGKGSAVEVAADATLTKVAGLWDASGEKIAVTFVETADRSTDA
jgi:hypothetical protein